MPPDHVNMLTISGFKSIKDARIELGALNILIGPNGSGKTNLASAFRLLKAWVDRQLQTFVARSGGANALFHFGAKQTKEIRFSIKTNCAEGECQADLSFEWAATDKLAIQREGLIEPDGFTVFSEGEFESQLSDIRKAPILAGNPAIFLQHCIIAHFDDTTPAARIRTAGDIGNNLVLNGDGRNLAAFLYKLQRTMPEHFRLVENTTRLVAPYFERFSLAPDGLNPNMIRLRWREMGADEDFGVDVLSDGTLRFIALAAMLLQPKETLPSLLFIDEPELGLHPYAMTVLAGLIRQASHDCQIVVATQSPALLDQFGPKDVIVVDRMDRATSFKRLEPSELAEWLEEYTLSELWEKNIFGGRPHR